MEFLHKYWKYITSQAYDNALAIISASHKKYNKDGERDLYERQKKERETLHQINELLFSEYITLMMDTEAPARSD